MQLRSVNFSKFIIGSEIFIHSWNVADKIHANMYSTVELTMDEVYELWNY
jgi:hypothetical protein